MKLPKRAPLVCLAASGGGHLRQLTDLHQFWQDFPYFFVTEDTALGRSIAKDHDTEFVPHFALGQARLGAPFKMLSAAFIGLWKALAIIWRRRPDIVITTGAGSQVYVVFWARIMGAKIVLIDSFARFERPSAFARLAGPMAHRRYAQSAKSAEHWPGAIVYDPLKPLDTQSPIKDGLLFATVGATLPFARLQELVRNAKCNGDISEQVIMQVGEGAEATDQCQGLEAVSTLPFAEVKQLLERASIVICHGGTGSIITALQHHCRVIVIPRQFELGEHYDDHQTEIAECFVARGLVHVASDAGSLAHALEQARRHRPRPFTTDYRDLISDLREYLAETSQQH